MLPPRTRTELYNNYDGTKTWIQNSIDNMGKFKEFSINLDGGKENYFAGEVISGNVILHLSVPIQMLRLILFVEGKARCTNGSTLSEQVHMDQKKLFGTSPTLSNSSNVEHPSGHHVYPFQFLLPEQLPSTVKETNGLIKYKLTARIIFKGLKGLISKDWRVTKPIRIKQVIDGNLDDNKQSVKQVLKRTPGFFSKKNLHKEDLLVTLERSMYCPGEEAKIFIRYKEVIAKRMGNIKVRLNKYVLFNPKENRRRYASKKIIQELTDDKKQSDRIYQRILAIPIPESTSPTNVLTNALKLNYTIHMKIDGYPELKIPLCIGTKPYQPPPEVNEEEQRAIQLAIEMSNQDANDMTGPDESQSGMDTPCAGGAPFIINSTPSAPPYSGPEEWLENFMVPPEYIPENEFDLPPSYDEAIGAN